jgi:hypothetical protein
LCGTPRRQAALNDDSIDVLVTHTRKCGIELIAGSQYYRLDCDACGFATGLDMLKEGFGKRIGSIAQRSDLR